MMPYLWILKCLEMAGDAKNKYNQQQCDELEDRINIRRQERRLNSIVNWKAAVDKKKSYKVW